MDVMITNSHSVANPDTGQPKQTSISMRDSDGKTYEVQLDWSAKDLWYATIWRGERLLADGVEGESSDDAFSRALDEAELVLIGETGEASLN